MSLQPLALDAVLAQALAGVSTATLTTVLLKQGLRNVWLRGTRPLTPVYPQRFASSPETRKLTPKPGKPWGSWRRWLTSSSGP